ncbi:flagellar type III secretion system pore protein FliP [bacterium 3DAC]|nr:flagellar type III secretion system pore protein FliP [Dictyoglomota bacterium]UZN22978.1 flagellar type III secretion system pore protein FliP [bacterium 3DAC]
MNTSTLVISLPGLGNEPYIVQIIALLTVLSIAPYIIMFFTTFLRISIVFSFLRNAMGLQQFPSAQVFVTLSLILTFVIMKPTFTDIYANAWVPYSNGDITLQEFVDRSSGYLEDFMLKQTDQKDLEMMFTIAGEKPPAKAKDTPFAIAAGAFMVSELKKAFLMGFLIYLPFIALDIVVASVLMSLGMFMIPPMMISLPLKVMLFIIANGWDLVIMGLARSFK